MDILLFICIISHLVAFFQSTTSSYGLTNHKQLKQTTNNKTTHSINTNRRRPHRRMVHPSLYASWDEYGNLCILAKFQATFTIKYETSSGTAQIIDKMPVDASSLGRCDQFDDKPMLDLVWKHSQKTGSQNTDNKVGFTFRMTFIKFPEDNMWGVEQMQLSYNTGHPVFQGAINPQKYVVTSDIEDYRLQFHTHLKHSMLCPSPPPIQLYDKEKNIRVIARLNNMQVQAYEFGDPKETNNFDPFMRCGQVSFGSGVAHPLTNFRNESITFAVGVFTVFIAALTVVGYALYRSHMVSREAYQKNVI